MHLIVARLLLDALETALSGSGRRSPVATTVSAMLTVVALGATLWILSAAPLDGPAAPIAAGIDALRRAAPPPAAAAVAASWSPLPAPLPAMMPPGAGIPIWPWLLAAVVVGAIWRGRARPRRRRLRRVGAGLPLLAANWRRAVEGRRAFLRERARRRRWGACDGAR
jgi:hypothetical protein